VKGGDGLDRTRTGSGEVAERGAAGAPPDRRPSVVVIGAGFGGLRVARGLARLPVDVTVVDQNNYHLFVPLLYQVATAGLEAEEIAQPVRRILSGQGNLRFRLGRVTDVDLEAGLVRTDTCELPYDFLVIAAGSTTNYFGLESVERTACTLRTLDDAEMVRDRVLSALEEAVGTDDPVRRRELMTFVCVGGGPTGVELAGALAELRRHVLPRDYPELAASDLRIVLLEATDRLLPGFRQRSQARALEQLVRMGVEVRLNAPVVDADEGGVTLKGGERIGAGVVVWVAGMRAAPLATALETPKGPGGRIIVRETLQLPEHPRVYAIGDIAHVETPRGRSYPMMAPVAIQQGDLVVENIRRQLDGKRPRRFRYRNPGAMATIGRQSAVAEVYGLQFGGLFAWVLWLAVHLFWLIGLRNRILVLVNWAWNYFTYDRSVRIIRRRSPARGR